MWVIKSWTKRHFCNINEYHTHLLHLHGEILQQQRNSFNWNCFYMQSCINFSTEIHAYQTEICMYKMSMTYCIKKLIHFLPSQLHGVFCCNRNSSCESFISTLIMDSIDPLTPSFLSSSCMWFGRFVGCKDQQWETSCPFLWQNV